VLLGLLLAVSLVSPLLFRIAREDILFIIAGGILGGIGSLTAIWLFSRHREIVKTFFFVGMLILLLYAIFDAVSARRFMRRDGRVLAEQCLAPVSAGAPARTYGLENTQRQIIVAMLVQRNIPAIPSLPALKEWICESKEDAYVVAEWRDAKKILADPDISVESCSSFSLEKRDMMVVRIMARKRNPLGINHAQKKEKE
jgi:hypothetical protein